MELWFCRDADLVCITQCTLRIGTYHIVNHTLHVHLTILIDLGGLHIQRGAQIGGNLSQQVTGSIAARLFQRCAIAFTRDVAVVCFQLLCLLSIGGLCTHLYAHQQCESEE